MYTYIDSFIFILEMRFQRWGPGRAALAVGARAVQPRCDGLGEL